jgi:hypothetical protein
MRLRAGGRRKREEVGEEAMKVIGSEDHRLHFPKGELYGGNSWCRSSDPTGGT